jgi:hypothetical protein
LRRGFSSRHPTLKFKNQTNGSAQWFSMAVLDAASAKGLMEKFWTVVVPIGDPIANRK